MNGDDRRTVAVASFAHGLVHTYELTIPLLIPLWMSTFSADAATIGVVVTVGYGLFGVGALPSGILADRYDTRTLIAASAVGMGAGFGLLAFAPNLLVLTVGLLLWGGAASIYHPTGLSLLSRTVSERGRGLAVHGVAGNLGTAMGPLAVSVLLADLYWRYVAALLVVPGVLIGALTLVVHTDPTGREEVEREDGFRTDLSMASFLSSSKRLFERGFYVIFLLVVLEGLFYRGVLTFLPDVFETAAGSGAVFSGLLRDMSGYLYSGLLLVGVVGQYVGGWLVDRTDPVRGLILVFLCLAAVSTAFATVAADGSWSLVPLSVLLGVFLFGEQPLMQATVADHSSSDTRGLSYGYTYAGVFGIGALGATLAGYVLTRASVASLFAVLATVAVAAAVVSAYLRGRHDGSANTSVSLFNN
ncbi:MFS transporter [Haladaptatus sp. AB643]|uniref:MFS transporter n=1 Tax=Haladaptatus sp. AB643 TaxID=2934174 RepID=UPI00209C5E8D|nr:MFS transporter [Haladaptatus sp. AB643]MCO8243791.1 MFS transporter [Haladaptatus sp. AB643]